MLIVAMLTAGYILSVGCAGLSRFGRRIHAAWRIRSLCRFPGGGGCRLGLLGLDPPLVGDPFARRLNHLLRAFGTDSLDLEVIFVRFGKLLGRAEAPLVEQLGVDVADSGDRVE